MGYTFQTLGSATLPPPTAEQVKASIAQVQTAASTAGFWPTPPNSIDGVYSAELHEALSRWAQRTGFALWTKQTYSLPTPGTPGSYIAGPGGMRIPTTGIRLDGSGPKQTVITNHLQAFLATQGILDSRGIVWTVNQGNWLQPPTWWVFETAGQPTTPPVQPQTCTCPPGYYKTTVSSMSAWPVGAIRPTGTCPLASKSSSYACLPAAAPPCPPGTARRKDGSGQCVPITVMVDNAPCPEGWSIASRGGPTGNGCPPGSRQTGMCCSPPEDQPTPPLVVVPPGPQPPAEAKSASPVGMDWVRANWKWLAALAAVGGGTYWWAKNRKANA